MEISIQLSSVLGEEKKVLAKLEELLLLSACSESNRMDIKTAAAEACLNAIEHGNKFNPELSVRVNIQIVEDEITIEVCDWGEGAELKSQTSECKADNQKDRGWGLLFIDQLSDEWDYYYKPENKQFCVRLKKNFSELVQP